MSAKQAYRDYQAALANAEKISGLYLADECVDAENVDSSVERDSDEWFEAMLSSAKAGYNMRCEENGVSSEEALARFGFGY